MQHERELYALWQARHKRDVAAEVAPFLNDNYDGIETSAVRVLARLKTPTAKKVLWQHIKNWQNEQNLPIDIMTLEFHMALSRAQSRDPNI